MDSKSDSPQRPRWCLRRLFCCFHRAAGLQQSQEGPAHLRCSPKATDSVSTTNNLKTQSDYPQLTETHLETSPDKREIGLESMIQNFSMLEISQVANDEGFSFSDSEGLPSNFGAPVESFVSQEPLQGEEGECSLSIYENLKFRQGGGRDISGSGIAPGRPLTPAHYRVSRLRRYHYVVPNILAEPQSEDPV